MNQHIDTRINTFDAADEAEYNRVQSVLAQRARQDASNAYMQTKMANVDAADEAAWEDDLSNLACVAQSSRAEEENSEGRHFWQTLGFWMANGFDLAQGVEDGVGASKMVVNSLDNGNIGFSGPRSIRDLFNINGTYYRPSTLGVSSAAKGIFKSAAKNGTVLFSFGVSTVVNIYDYQWGEHKDKGVLSQEFGVSTIVDTVFAVGVGLLAAGAVAVGVAIFSAGVVVSTPALVAIAAITALTAIGLGLVVDIKLDWPNQAKDVTNQRLNDIQGGGQ